MKFPRTSGILLHPTSLPGPYGIGDLGDSAREWVDFLAETGQTLWQIMPLGYTGFGDSPYQSFSAFAGDPLLISLDVLGRQGLLTHQELADVPKFPHDKVDYGPVIQWKMDMLRHAARRFETPAGAPLKDAFGAFKKANADWLDDFALFMALKELNGGEAWNRWEPPLRDREPEMLAEWRQRASEGIALHEFMQFAFYSQWLDIKKYANDKSIQVIGDVPIFVAYDSDDVWAHRSLFDVDDEGNLRSMAGVPPDYFSKTGQLWGNPLYNWDEMGNQGYTWWIRRFKGALALYDIVRIDHFRGFEAYWSVPAGEKTAVHGKWIKGPGRDLFLAVKEALGDLPIIAEDLGLLTADVIALRDEMGFPGMKILQFAFGDDPRQEYLPHNHVPNCVVYTGTHDNDTSLGWWTHAQEKEREFLSDYLGGADPDGINWNLIRMAFGSIADLAVVPLQDVLGLGSEARMNTPGVAGGNWSWRYKQGELSADIRKKLKMITYTYARGLPPKASVPPAKQKRPHAGHVG